MATLSWLAAITAATGLVIARGPTRTASGAPVPPAFATAAGADGKPDTKSPLDRKIPSVHFTTPMAADEAVGFLQDVSRTTITVDWKKLGISGDKPIKLDIDQPTLRQALMAVVQAAGAKGKVEMKAEGTAVTVTAAAKTEEGNDKR